MNTYQDIMAAAAPGKKLDADSQKHKMTFFELCCLLAIFIYPFWGAFSGFLLHVDGAGRIANMMMIAAGLVCIFVYSKNLVKYKKPLLIWGCWCGYTIINIMFQGLSETFFDNYLDMLLKIIVKYLFLLVMLTMFERLPEKTSLTIIQTLFCSCFLYTCHGEWITTGKGYDRFYSDVINANEIAYVAITLIFFILYYIAIFQKNIFVKWFLGQIMIYAVFLIFQTACRTAAVCLLVLLLASIWSFLRKRFSNRLSFIFCILLFVFTFSFVSRSIIGTTVGQRFVYRAEEVSKYNYDDSLLVEILGERSGYVLEGVELWVDHKWFGVGYGNYINYSRSEHRNHIEYMGQLSENGIFGFLLFIAFLMAVYKKSVPGIYKKSLLTTQNTLLLGGFITLLIFNVGLFTVSGHPFYIISACLLAKFGKEDEAAPEEGSAPENPVQTTEKPLPKPML